MYELTIDWPPVAEAEAVLFVKPAAAVLERHGFTAGECFLQMILQDIGEPFDEVRVGAWVEAGVAVHLRMPTNTRYYEARDSRFRAEVGRWGRPVVEL